MAVMRPLQTQMYLEDSIEAGISEDVRKQYADIANTGVAAWEKAWKETQAEVRCGSIDLY